MASSATANILLRVAPGTVWKAWRNLKQWPEWQPETVKAHWVDGSNAWEIGSRFMLLRQIPFGILGRIPGANSRSFIGEVLSTAEEQLLVWELRPSRVNWFGPIIVQSVRLTPAPSGTTVTLTLSTHGLGPTLLRPFLGGRLQSQAEATLEGLRYQLLPIIRGR
ncbi:MAG: SRPBCC family protein [Ardenticatenaceae bacterium]